MHININLHFLQHHLHITHTCTHGAVLNYDAVCCQPGLLLPRQHLSHQLERLHTFHSNEEKQYSSVHAAISNNKTRYDRNKTCSHPPTNQAFIWQCLTFTTATSTNPAFVNVFVCEHVASWVHDWTRVVQFLFPVPPSIWCVCVRFFCCLCLSWGLFCQTDLFSKFPFSNISAICPTDIIFICVN